MHLPLDFLLLVVLSIPATLPYAAAALVNITIDDTFGDPLTGTQIVYEPPGVWKLGRNCTDCTAAPPDLSQIQNGTWHDGTFNPTHENGGSANQLLIAAVPFQGVAVYVYCIVTHSIQSPIGNSDMFFFIDGVFVGRFQQPPTGDTTYEYNVPVYSNNSLPSGPHTIAIVNGQVNGNQTLTLLDYIVYTRDINSTSDSTGSTSSPTPSSVTPTPSSPSSSSSTSMATTSSNSHTRTIIIAVVCSIGGILVVMALVATVIYFRRRHPKYNPPADGILSTDPTPMDEEDPATSGWAEGTWTGDDDSTERRTASTGKRKRGPSNASSNVASPQKSLPKLPSVQLPVPLPPTNRVHPSLHPLSRARAEPVSPSSSFGNLASPPPNSATFLLSPSAPPVPSHRPTPSETFLDMGHSYNEAGVTTLSTHNAHPFATAHAAVAPSPSRQRSNTTLGTAPNASTSSLSAAQRGPAYQDRSPSKKPSGSDIALSSAPSSPPSANTPIPSVTSTATTPTSATMLMPNRKQSVSTAQRRVDPIDPAMQPPRDPPSRHPSHERERHRERSRGQRAAHDTRARGRDAQAQAEKAQLEGQDHRRNRSGRRQGMMLSERDQKRFGFLDVPVDASDSRPPSYRENT